MSQTKTKFLVSGMSCAHCELTIENTLSKLKGIKNTKASFGKGEVNCTFDDEVISLEEIKAAINNSDYKIVEEERKPRLTGNTEALYILIILLGGYVVLKQLGILTLTNYFPKVHENMSYGMIFVIGVLTSLHCVAMCGGINLAQSTNFAKSEESAVIPNLLYNFGRVVSYTVIGGIVGALGSVITFGGGFKGAVAIFAGVFMMIMGINMLNIFPWLRRFNLKIPKFLGRKITNKKARSHTSFYIGLLNGLMPCGPLQSIQLFALSTGSAFYGALSMFLFSLGTVPLMFVLGTLSSKLNKKFTQKMLSVCAILVVILGIGMINNGLALSGVKVSTLEPTSASTNVAKNDGGIQKITTPLEFGTYPSITVKAGIPVKWTIIAQKGKVNGCNNEIIISEYGVVAKLKEGENIIEFIPTQAGQYGYSCWMGMIRSTITVVE